MPNTASPLVRVLREHWLQTIMGRGRLRVHYAVCGCGGAFADNGTAVAAIEDWVQHVAALVAAETQAAHRHRYNWTGHAAPDLLGCLDCSHFATAAERQELAGVRA